MKVFRIVFSIVILFSYIKAGAQDEVRIQRLALPVEFDGSPFEKAWDDLRQYPLKMYRPDAGADPSEKTEVMIGYDDEFLWVGARLYMADANKIMSTSKSRDETSKTSDSFGILLDTYNDNENAFAFFTMPTGLRLDYTVFNDANPQGSGSSSPIGSGTNTSWNSFWDVKTTRDDKGWYVEMKIPFSSLRFKPENDLSTMGLLITRTISSKSETVTYPEVDPLYGLAAMRKPSLAADVAFEGVKPSRPVYFSPYVIGGYSSGWALNPELTGYLKDDEPDFNMGLDLKYNINSNLTLDLTVNTDFAQVEADNQQVNLTRYSLYLPEKRLFFQERSSLFNFNLGGSSNLFYSRNIGLAQGQPVSILGGARIVGRIGKWDVGLIDLQTEEFSSVTGEDTLYSPGENFGVLRLRRRVINDNSYVGGIFTSRIGMDGSHNLAYGADGIFRVFGLDYLDVKLAGTTDSDTTNDIPANDPLFFSATWERRTEEGFAYKLGYSYSGEEFDPGIGYVQQGSMQDISGQLLYGWMPGAESKLFTHNAYLRFSRSTRLEDNRLESLTIQPGWELHSKGGYRWEFSVYYNQEGVKNSFLAGGNLLVPAGEYTFYNTYFRLNTPTSRKMSAQVTMYAGQYYDGERYSLTVAPSINLSSSIQLSPSYQITRVSFGKRDQKGNIHSTSLRSTFMLNTKLSASLFVQYLSSTDDLVGNIRLRYNPREGNDFYIVYNEYRGIDDGTNVPVYPDYFIRSIMLKYTHTFIF